MKRCREVANFSITTEKGRIGESHRGNFAKRRRDGAYVSLKIDSTRFLSQTTKRGNRTNDPTAVTRDNFFWINVKNDDIYLCPKYKIPSPSLTS